MVEQHEIPLPSLAEQQSIVEDIEAEEVLIEANRELVERFQGKIQAAVARVWKSGTSGATAA